MGQGLGAITILNGQRSVSEQSPIKLTVGQIRTKAAYRLPPQMPEPNTAEIDPDAAKIPEYHKESDCSSNESKHPPSSTFQTPVATLKAQSQEISKANTIKGKFKTAGRQSMAASPYIRDHKDGADPPAKALQLHRTPNIVRKVNIHLDNAQVAGPIIPGFSMMNKTINVKQFESQDEGTPQNRTNRNSHHVGKDSSFNEWQSKFDQPTSQLMTTLY